MKIPFSIKYRPQIESGEYKVIDRCGYVLTLKDITNDAWYFSLRYPNTDYETERIYDHPENHLFIITPEEELTDFENAFGRAMMEVPDPEEKEEWYPFLKEKAAELLSIAKKELYTTIKRELEDNPDGWVQRVEDAYNSGLKVGYKNGKAEALKDLPRWKEINNAYYLDKEGFDSEFGILFYHGNQISIDELKKLPKSKED